MRGRRVAVTVRAGRPSKGRLRGRGDGGPVVVRAGRPFGALARRPGMGGAGRAAPEERGPLPRRPGPAPLREVRSYGESRRRPIAHGPGGGSGEIRPRGGPPRSGRQKPGRGRRPAAVEAGRSVRRESVRVGVPVRSGAGVRRRGRWGGVRRARTAGRSGGRGFRPGVRGGGGRGFAPGPRAEGARGGARGGASTSGVTDCDGVVRMLFTGGGTSHIRAERQLIRATYRWGASDV